MANSFVFTKLTNIEVPQLWEQREQIFKQNEVDLKDNEKVDSSGIAFLVQWAKSTKDKKKKTKTSSSKTESTTKQASTTKEQTTQSKTTTSQAPQAENTDSSTPAKPAAQPTILDTLVGKNFVFSSGSGGWGARFLSEKYP